MMYGTDSADNSRERLRGVRRTKSGKYGSVINDPIKKKQVWLGSFDSAEEAADAYLSKRLELQEQLKAKVVARNQPIVGQESSCANVTCRRDSAENSGKIQSGKYGSVVNDPIKEKQVSLGSFDNDEEAANAYLSKKCEFQEQLKAKQAVQCQSILSQESDHENMTCRRNSAENSIERLTGVRRSNSGKYVSAIRDPIRKKRIHLGTFRTAEEAANAYLSKKCEFQQQLKAKQVVQRRPIPGQKSGCENMRRRKDSAENSRERLTGVRRRNSGNYTSEIQDPIRKKKIHLGTFRTAQEARNAYLSKKCEFQGRLKAKQVAQGQPIPSLESGCTVMTDTRDLGKKSRKIYSGVTRRKSGRYASTINDPINGKTIWLGTFDTSEEAANAHHSKQVEFKVRQGVQHICCKESEIESSHEASSSMPETEALTSRSSPDYGGSKSETCNANAVEIVKVENDEGFIMGLFKAVPNCQGVNVGSESFFPILDKNGFLLGEFSKLDDLSICQNEDDYLPTKF